jgi:hypothetical protein
VDLVPWWTKRKTVTIARGLDTKISLKKMIVVELAADQDAKTKKNRNPVRRQNKSGTKFTLL